MSNSYTQCSCKLPLTADQQNAAEAILKEAADELANGEEGYCGVQYTVRPDGVWFHEDESITLEHLEHLVYSVLDGLKIDTPFIFTWADTCSKPIADAFGGGACVVKRGYRSFWVNPDEIARKHRFTKSEKITKGKS